MRTRFVVWLLIFLVAPCVAQTSLPEKGNKKLPFKETMCHADEVFLPNLPAPRLPPPTLDPACKFGGQGLIASSVIGRRLLDVRPAADFLLGHARDAINISADLVKTKQYWQNEPILLLGSGKGDRNLFEACADLRRRGFKDVKVLTGGMVAWQRAGLAVIPDQVDQFRSAGLTPRELYLEHEESTNLLLDAFGFEDGDGKAAEESRRRLVSLARRHKQRATVEKVIVVAGPWLDRATADAVTDLYPRQVVLFFTAPREQYEKFVRDQDAMLAAAGRPRHSRCSAL